MGRAVADVVTVATRPLWAGRVAALLGIVLLAFSLRTAVASLSPVIFLVGQDFAVSPAVAGLIGTAPPICFAVFGIVTPMLERRIGLQPLVVVVLAVISVGLVARAFSTSAVLLLVVTAMLFAGVAAGNILLPALTKRYFPDRLGLLTTLYATVMSIATFLPPLVAVPVAGAVGWRTSLGMWAVFSLAGLVPWIAMLLAGRRTGAVAPGHGGASSLGRMWRLPLAWAMTAAFVVTSSTAYVAFAWLPAILVDVAGVTAAEAGALLSLFAAVGLPCSLVIPLLVTRSRRAVGPLFAFAVTCGLTGYLGLLLAPAAAPALWVVLIGFAPLLFPLVLFLLGQRTRSHGATVALSGFVQSAGYGITAVLPVLVGILHESTGGWTVPLTMMLVVVLIGIPAGVVVSRPHTIEDSWERRHGPW